MNVLITGAFGRVGSALIDHLPDRYDLHYLDREVPEEYNAHTADIANYESLKPAFDETDAVVHLAAASDVDSAWVDVLDSNIIGLKNVLTASKEAKVETFVFASSNHVMGMYEKEHAPEIYQPEYNLTLGHLDPPRPDSYYACSKLFGEGMVRYFTEDRTYPKSAYSLRLGTILSSEFDNPYGLAEKGVADEDWLPESDSYSRAVERMHATWQSRRDVAELVDSCLFNNSVTYDMYYGVSDNSARFLDISRAKDVIGYKPQDSADRWAAQMKKNESE
jgi:nucleoside-diphosphate-sugar epimerase